MKLSYTTHDAMSRAQQTLLERVPAGATVYTIVRSVSASGMQRTVSVVMVERFAHRAAGTGQIVDITGLVATALDWKRNQDGYLVVRGAQMSVCDHVVGALAWCLYGSDRKLVSSYL